MLYDDAESNASGLNVPDQKYYYKNKKSEDNYLLIFFSWWRRPPIKNFKFHKNYKEQLDSKLLKMLSLTIHTCILY